MKIYIWKRRKPASAKHRQIFLPIWFHSLPILPGSAAGAAALKCCEYLGHTFFICESYETMDLLDFSTRFFLPCVPQISWPLERFSTEIKLTNMSQLTSQENNFCTPLMPVVFRGIHHSSIKVSGYRCYFQVFPPSFKSKDWTRWDVGFQDLVAFFWNQFQCLSLMCRLKMDFSEETLFWICFLTNMVYK